MLLIIAGAIIVALVIGCFAAAAGLLGDAVRGMVGRPGALALLLIGVPILGALAPHPGPLGALLGTLLIAGMIVAVLGSRHHP